VRIGKLRWKSQRRKMCYVAQVPVAPHKTEYREIGFAVDT